MTDLRLALFLAAILLEGLLLATLFLAFRRKIALWMTAVLAVIPQAMCVIVFISGAELQAGYAWWSRVQLAAAAPPYEPFTASGDPGLHHMVSAQPLSFRRPDIGDVADLTAWQRKLRPDLREDVFTLPPVGVRSATEPFTVLSTIDLPGGVRRQFVT